MIITHQGKTPNIHASAWVAPDATLCGDVTIGPHSRVLHGARLIAEGRRIEIGECVVVLENAVVRSTARHNTRIGDHCLVGPHAHLVGCQVDDEVFIATGSAIFHGSHLERGSEVRINGVVHVNSRLPEKSTVPIGWVAVGDPARVLPPNQHDEIWTLQKPMNFPWEAYGLSRDEANMKAITEQMCEALSGHVTDTEFNS